MTKFTDEKTRNIIKFYGEGLPLKYCAAAVGICRATVYNWVARGEKAKSGKYHNFYLEMMNARSKFIAYHQKKINDSKDWRASQYLLQVTDPEYYILQDKLKLESKQEITVNSFDEDLFNKLLEEEEEDEEEDY